MTPEELADIKARHEDQQHDTDLPMFDDVSALLTYVKELKGKRRPAGFDSLMKLHQETTDKLAAAEKVIELGEGLLNRLEELCGFNPTWADEMALFRASLDAYDKLKEEK